MAYEANTVPGGVSTHDQVTEYAPSGMWPTFAVAEYGIGIGDPKHGGPGFGKLLVIATLNPITEVPDTMGGAGPTQVVVPESVTNTLPSGACVTVNISDVANATDVVKQARHK